MIIKFRVEFLEEATEFLDGIDVKAREKIIYNIHKAQVSNNKELFKKLTGEIWAFRTLYNRTYYRLFAFWDKTEKTNTIVISTHGRIKKTAKIQSADLQRAARMMNLYFELKKTK